MLGILLREENCDVEFPFIFTGPEGSEAYFEQIDKFIGATLGERAQSLYKVIVNDPAAVATEMKRGFEAATEQRKEAGEAYHYNWDLFIPYELQKPFDPTHDNMAKLDLHLNQPDYLLAAELRRALSGIVAGNVKEQAVLAVETHGAFKLCGDQVVIDALSELLQGFIEQRRMKIDYASYTPCFELAC